MKEYKLNDFRSTTIQLLRCYPQFESLPGDVLWQKFCDGMKAEKETVAAIFEQVMLIQVADDLDI